MTADDAADAPPAEDSAAGDGDEAEVALGDAEELNERANDAVESMDEALAPAAAATNGVAPAAEAKPAPRVYDGPEPTTMEELLNEQATEIRSLKHGDVVEGTVVRIDKDEILVDIGAKSEGVISNRELYGRNAEASRS